MSARTIGVVTTSRADFGIYEPVLRAIEAHDGLELRLYVSGSHLSPEFGYTVDAIREAGFEPTAEIEVLLSSDTPQAIATATGLAVMRFAQLFSHERPDILVALGDRYEMAATVLAALPFGIPVAHLHGGETSQGAIDEALRHSITKMAHIHFPATERYGQRIVQLGEEPWRVHVTGAAGLDSVATLETASREALESHLGIDLGTAPLLVTLHPTTLAYAGTEACVNAMLEALAERSEPIVFTYPNADTSGRVIIEAIDRFVAAHPGRAAAAMSLGTRRYFGLMKLAAAMVGNSSSGIIEAASFGLPVVNIGNRQRGRDHGRNVLDADESAASIKATLERALDPAFSKSLAGMANPYGDGGAAPRIVEVLASVALDQAGRERLLVKRFHDRV